MPRGTTDGEDLQHLKVFRRPTKEGKTKWFCRGGFWVKNKNILTVDRALRTLVECCPDLSLSEIICLAVVNEAKRTQKRNSNPTKSD